MPANPIAQLLLSQAAQLEAAALAIVQGSEMPADVSFEVTEAEVHDSSQDDANRDESAPSEDARLWISRASKLAVILGHYSRDIESLGKWIDQHPDPEAPAEDAEKYLMPDGSFSNSASAALAAWYVDHPARADAEQKGETRRKRRARNAKMASSPEEDKATLDTDARDFPDAD